MMTEDELWEAWLDAHPEDREFEMCLGEGQRSEFRSKMEDTIEYSSYRFNRFLWALAGVINSMLSEWVRSLSNK